jgi:hypothetical protein
LHYLWLAVFCCPVFVRYLLRFFADFIAVCSTFNVISWMPDFAKVFVRYLPAYNLSDWIYCLVLIVEKMCHNPAVTNLIFVSFIYQKTSIAHLFLLVYTSVSSFDSIFKRVKNISLVYNIQTRARPKRWVMWFY